MWKLELDEEYFRIFGSDKNVAGYFDPDYGDIFPKEKEEEIIQEMLKSHEKILGGFLTVPLLKFGIFDTDLNTDIDSIEGRLADSLDRLKRWRKAIKEINPEFHAINISHTDQDMLSISFSLNFGQKIPLKKESILEKLNPILDLLHKYSLL